MGAGAGGVGVAAAVGVLIMTTWHFYVLPFCPTTRLHTHKGKTSLCGDVCICVCAGAFFLIPSNAASSFLIICPMTQWAAGTRSFL